MMKKKNCDKECMGIVKNIEIKGMDFPSVLTIQYEVKGKEYEIKEKMVMKVSEKKKVAFITLGYKTKSLIEIRTGIPLNVGSEVKVKYCSSDPSIAFLPDNDDSITLD